MKKEGSAISACVTMRATTGGAAKAAAAPAGSGEYAVGLESVSYSYGPTVAVDKLDLRVGHGEVLALLGPNGAGKSTSISLLLGLLSPASGSVTLFGRRPEQAIRAGLAAAMLQENQLLPRATVDELLRFTHGLYHDPMPIADVAELAGISHLLRRTTEGLSGGQAQRVRFALAITGRPALLVLDEPTAALDVEARREFWAAIDTYAANGRAVLFSTHYLEEADEHAQRVVVIAAGTKIADGTPAEIRRMVPGRTVTIDLPPANHRFRYATPPAAEEPAAPLADLPGVASVSVTGSRAQLRCLDSDATVAALAAAGLLRNLEVTGSSLEEAFLSITHAAKGVTP